MKPSAGYPAEFAFAFAQKAVYMYASVVHTATGYRLRVAVPGVPAALGFVQTSLTFFGDPAAMDGAGSPGTAFLTNPSDCGAAPVTTRVEADSWKIQNGGSVKESTTYPQLTGCNLLQFNSSLEVAPLPSSEGGSTGAGRTVGLRGRREGSTDDRVVRNSQSGIWSSDGHVARRRVVGATGGTGPSRLPEHRGRRHQYRQYGNSRRWPRCRRARGDGTGNGQRGQPVRRRPVSHRTGTLPGGVDPGHRRNLHANPPERSQRLCASARHVYLAQPKCGGEGQAACSEASATNGELFGAYIEAEGFRRDRQARRYGRSELGDGPAASHVR